MVIQENGIKVLSKSIEGKQIHLYGVNANLLYWVQESELARIALSGVKDYEGLLYTALGATSESDRIRASKEIIYSLWHANPVLGPYPFLDTLSEFEFDRLFYAGYRDHVGHQLKVYLLGLYIYDKCLTIKRLVLQEVEAKKTIHLSAESEFLFRWLITSVYHDIGYILENQEADEATGKAWIKTRDTLNQVLSAPLSALPSLQKRKLSPEVERRIIQKNKLWVLTIISPSEIEQDGETDLFDFIAEPAVCAGLGPIEGQSSPLKRYYEYTFKHSTASQSRPRFRDHGIVSALLLLRVWRYFAEYVQRVANLNDEVLLRNVAGEIMALSQNLSNHHNTITSAAGAIALHNINKYIWDPADALASSITLSEYCISLNDSTLIHPKGNTPLAFLLGLVDSLQGWDRPMFRAPHRDDAPILTGGDISITAESEKIFLYFPEDANRFRKPDREIGSLFSKTRTALSSYLQPDAIESLISWAGNHDKVDTEVENSLGGSMVNKNKEYSPTSRLEESENAASIAILPLSEEPPYSSSADIDIRALIGEKRWILGAYNFDEDLHFSSFYLRKSLKANLPEAFKSYGYQTIIAVYKDFNEAYYIPESECERVATALIKNITKNPLSLQDVLDEIHRRANELRDVFQFEYESIPFADLPIYDLLKLYRQHNEVHYRLYEYARIPEALDRGLNLFTTYLKNYLRNRGPHLANRRNLNLIFEMLTFPEQMSVAGMEDMEFYKILEKIKNEEGYGDAFGSSTRRIILRADPRLLSEIEEYRSKWMYWGYHGYGTRALRDVSYFLEKIKLALESSVRPHALKLNETFEDAEYRRMEAFDSYQIDATHQMLFRLHSRVGTTKLYRRYIQLRNFYFLDRLLAEFSKRLMVREEVIRSLMPEELEQVVAGNASVSVEQEARARGVVFVLHNEKEAIISGDSVNDLIGVLGGAVIAPIPSEGRLIGTPVSSGVARGRCRVVIRPDDDAAQSFNRGDILISESTDPDLFDLMKIAGAVVTQAGGVTSHAAIVCREIGVPALVGVSGLLERVATGTFVVVDADDGILTIINPTKDGIIIHDWDILRRRIDVGPKAQALARLLEMGFKVPAFFAIPWEFLSVATPVGTPDGMGSDSQILWSEIRDALQRLGGELFALRSSTAEEDQPEFSGAGGQKSEIHVAREDVANSLMRIAAEEIAKNNEAPKGSVIVQDMILGDVSGVLFTVDPVTQNRDIVVIEAIPGGNELLTAGHIVPVRYFIERRTKTIIKEESGGQWAGLLDTGMVHKLLEEAEKIELAFGTPQDIEWTSVNRQVWILQSRPVTVLSETHKRISHTKSAHVSSKATRDIVSIYRAYRIHPSLQCHMLTVAGIASWIIERWEGSSLNERDILETLLLHDIGNIIKADYLQFPVLFPDDLGHLEYWKAVQAWMMRRYGKTDQEVTLKIADELGVSNRVRTLLQLKQFVRNNETLASDDYELKICAYSDQRVAPRGILPLRARLMEAVRRYANVTGASINHPSRDTLMRQADEIERQIFRYLNSFQPSDIHDHSVAPYIAQLRGFELTNGEG